ncbi:MAG: cytochrome c [Proteobacteria bacterium]|nr:cytochrome c [Pseudomonadota bacterium]
MKRAICTVVTLFLIGQMTNAWGFPWNKDFVDQLAIKAQESLAPAEPGSTPVVGGETLPALPANISEEEMDALKDAAAVIPNPIPASAASVARGAELYAMTCVVCHGTEGLGDGPVGLHFDTKSPVDLNEDYTQDQADGSLFFTLTRGRALMPFYRDALNVEERWHVINYVKTEFGP